jgi:hypothetical protein
MPQEGAAVKWGRNFLEIWGQTPQSLAGVAAPKVSKLRENFSDKLEGERGG